MTTDLFVRLAIIISILVTSTVKAESIGVASEQSQTSSSGAAASNQGNAQTVVNQASPGLAYSGSYNLRSAPPVGAPSLTTTLTETCMGSSTGGLSLMGFGLSGGTTWKDEECIRRLNARELAQTLHEYDAAKELLCGNPEINEVYKQLNRPCLMTASGSTMLPGGAQGEYRDAVVPKPTETAPKLTSRERAAITESVTKEQAAAVLREKIEAAHAARAYMTTRGY